MSRQLILDGIERVGDTANLRCKNCRSEHLATLKPGGHIQIALGLTPRRDGVFAVTQRKAVRDPSQIVMRQTFAPPGCELDADTRETKNAMFDEKRRAPVQRAAFSILEIETRPDATLCIRCPTCQKIGKISAAHK